MRRLGSIFRSACLPVRDVPYRVLHIHAGFSPFYRHVSGRQDEEVIKSSWVHQMQRAKERPNLVHWRDELVAITKDSSEDFEDATLSVELMRVRCDVCYHEKSVSPECCRPAWNLNFVV